MTQQILSRQILNRRHFLAGTGYLALAINAAGSSVLFTHRAVAQTAPADLNNWVTITADGRITIKLGAAEMGQGVMTAIPLILAEELDADWAMVDVETVTHDPKSYGNPLTGGILYTAGSSSVEGYFAIMRRAGAEARRILCASAARAWNVPLAEVTTEPHTVLHAASNRRMSYGAIVALPEIVNDLPPLNDAELKPRSEWRLIGRDVERLDIPAKTRGETLYTVDVRVPGMIYATLLRAPVEGEKPNAIDAATAKAMAGIIDVIGLEDAVAILAETWEQAVAARDAVRVTWSETSPFRSADSAADLAAEVKRAADLTQAGTIWAERGDAPTILADGGNIIAADYTTEHVYHAQMEPLAAVAHVDADGKGAEIWVGTQSQTVTLNVALQVLETTPERIRFHALQMGGAFGRRTFFARELLRDALILSRAAKRPVKLIWTREDDVKNGWFRPATAHHLRARLAADGSVAAWHHRIACPSIFAFVAPQRLEGSQGRDLLVMEGTELADYHFPNMRAEHVTSERRARISAWRGIGWGHNLFASECFIDELAAAAGSDAIAFRRRHLAGNPRALNVLDTVLAEARYGQAPEGRAHGLSFAGYKGTLGCGVAEISLDESSGAIRVHRFWAAIDAGIVIQPHAFTAQAEGGIIYGLSGLLKERITISGGEVQQNNFYDYDVLRMDEAPEIKITLVPSEAAPTGAGEIGVPMTGAAIANAFFALTGKRLRQMPFTPERVMGVLSA